MSLGFQIVLDFGFEILNVTYYSPYYRFNVYSYLTREM